MNGLLPFFEYNGREKPVASISWILPPLILKMGAASGSTEPTGLGEIGE